MLFGYLCALAMFFFSCVTSLPFTFTINNDCATESSVLVGVSKRCDVDISSTDFYINIGPAAINVSIPAIDINFNHSNAVDAMSLASAYKFLGKSLRGAYNGSHGASFAANETINGLVDGNDCTAMTVVYARGTQEVGNVGSVTGPPFFAALADTLGSNSSLTVQGVSYESSIGGYLAGGSTAGSTNM